MGSDHFLDNEDRLQRELSRGTRTYKIVIKNWMGNNDYTVNEIDNYPDALKQFQELSKTYEGKNIIELIEIHTIETKIR